MIITKATQAQQKIAQTIIQFEGYAYSHKENGTEVWTKGNKAIALTDEAILKLAS